jgi:hypothetical protein
MGFERLSEAELKRLKELEHNTGGSSRGDVSTDQIKQAYRLGLIDIGSAFRAITALFRADNRKPIPPKKTNGS